MMFNINTHPKAPINSSQIDFIGTNLDKIRDYFKMREKIFYDKFNADWLKDNGKMPRTVSEMREYYKTANEKWDIVKNEINKMVYEK